MDKQLLIILHRFCRSEKIQNLAIWARIGYATIDKIMQRVFIAIYTSQLQEIHICWLVNQEKEETKE